MAKLKRTIERTVEPFDLSKLCTPASVYFVISLIFLVILGMNNLKESERLCLGDYSCYVGNNTMVFVLNAVYILFWTFILDLMCKNGYGSISWIILLFPFVLSFILLALAMMKSG